MVDEFVDRLKGRRRVESEGALTFVGDVYFSENGDKWLVVNAEHGHPGLLLDLDLVEPVSALKLLKRVVFVFVTLASVVVPLYWVFWRNV